VTAADAAIAPRDLEPRGAATADLAGWLSLAATPTFAVMATLTAVSPDGAMGALCGNGHGFAMGGMVPMYLLMSAFHLAPWLRFASRCRGVHRAAGLSPGSHSDSTPPSTSSATLQPRATAKACA
jgi:hypothetical protein